MHARWHFNRFKSIDLHPISQLVQICQFPPSVGNQRNLGAHLVNTYTLHSNLQPRLHSMVDVHTHHYCPYTTFKLMAKTHCLTPAIYQHFGTTCTKPFISLSQFQRQYIVIYLEFMQQANNSLNCLTFLDCPHLAEQSDWN